MERWKKILIFIAVVMFVAGLAVGIPLILKDVKLGKKLATPNNLVVVGTGEYVYATCGEVEGAKKYYFYIDDSCIELSSNSANLSSYMPQTKKYYISVACEGVKQKSKSDKSEAVSYSKTSVLGKPVLSINSDETGAVWSVVENATSYKIFLNGNPPINTESNSYQFSTLPSAGIWSIRIQAVSSNPLYIDGAFSNSLIYEKHIVLESPTAETLANGSVRIDKVENAVSYEVQIDSEVFEVGQFDGEYFDFDYTLFNASLPGTLKKIRAIGDGKYIDNSSFNVFE